MKRHPAGTPAKPASDERGGTSHESTGREHACFRGSCPLVDPTALRAVPAVSRTAPGSVRAHRAHRVIVSIATALGALIRNFAVFAASRSHGVRQVG